MEDIKLFEPLSSSNYKAMYPELRRVPEFDKLFDNDLKFVWYFANETSPYSKLEDKDRLEKSFFHVFGKGSDKKKQDEYLYKNFKPEIKSAIERMSKFSAGYRYRAFQMVEQIFKHHEKTIKEITNTTTSDATEQLKNISTLKVIVNELPELIKHVEEGFGIKTKSTNKNTGDDKGQSNISDYHKSKMENIK